MDWSEETVIKFIEDYKENTILWDTKLPDYGNTVLKEVALCTLAKKYDCDVSVIANKIITLRESFKQETRRMEQYGITSQWFGYRPLSFLLQDNLRKNIIHKWSEENVLSLINDYRANPCLWCSRRRRYTTLKQRKAIWALLAKKHNRGASDIKVKLKALRHRFREVHARSKRRGKPSNWFAYEALSFLEDQDDESLLLDGEEKLSEQNGNNHVIEDGPSSNKPGDDMSIDTIKIECDSEDSEQSVECFSQATSFLESTHKIANEPDPKIKILARNQPANFFSVTQVNANEEDSKFSRCLLPHIRKIPQHKMLSFRNKIQELVQKFAYDDYGESHSQSTLAKIEPDSSVGVGQYQPGYY